MGPMREEQNNLLVSSHKWAEGQNENFTTDAFAHLLRHFIEYDSKLAGNILCRITGDWLCLTDQECGAVRVDTQETIEKGRLDIRLSSPNHLAVIEVKDGAEVQAEQLKRYREYLDSSGFAQTRLVLLTRYSVLLSRAQRGDPGSCADEKRQSSGRGDRPSLEAQERV